MGETSTSVERLALERLVLAQNAGISSTSQGLYCLYCSWYSESYEAEPQHDRYCPILGGRRVLEKGNA